MNDFKKLTAYDESEQTTASNSSTPLFDLSDVSNRYQVTDIKLDDWESVVIGDTKTNKVVCHFITENGFNEALDIAKKITKFLNGC